MIDSGNASVDDRDSDAIENVEGLGMDTNIRINGGSKLFPGTNQYDCFMKCFCKKDYFTLYKMWFS